MSLAKMATCASIFSNSHIRGRRPSVYKKINFNISESFMCSKRGNSGKVRQGSWSRICCSAVNVKLLPAYATLLTSRFSGFENVMNIHLDTLEASEATSIFIQSLTVGDLDPATAKLAISILGPFLSAFGFLFILRIVMSWYPKLPVGKFPYVIAYAPTEPLLIPTRKVIPPVGGVDVTPVVWFGLLSFLNEILLGPQGLLVLLSQQVN